MEAITTSKSSKLKADRQNAPVWNKNPKVIILRPISMVNTTVKMLSNIWRICKNDESTGEKNSGTSHMRIDGANWETKLKTKTNRSSTNVISSWIFSSQQSRWHQNAHQNYVRKISVIDDFVTRGPYPGKLGNNIVKWNSITSGLVLDKKITRWIQLCMGKLYDWIILQNTTCDASYFMVNGWEGFEMRLCRKKMSGRRNESKWKVLLKFELMPFHQIKNMNNGTWK